MLRTGQMSNRGLISWWRKRVDLLQLPDSFCVSTTLLCNGYWEYVSWRKSGLAWRW